MFKSKKKVIILMVVAILSISTIANGESFNFRADDCTSIYNNNSRGNVITYGNSTPVANNYNTYKWQSTRLPRRGRGVKPSVPVTPPTTVKPPVTVTPPVVEKPVTPPVVPTRPTENVSGLSAMEMEVVRLVNIERQKAGLSAFKASSALSQVARTKSEDMAKNNYFSHTSPTYGSPFDMMKSFGISYKTAGENIAKGYSSAQAVVTGWMNSSGHRANILNASFNTIGVGAYTGNGSTYWTQMFTN